MHVNKTTDDATAFQNPVISCPIEIQTGFAFLVTA